MCPAKEDVVQDLLLGFNARITLTPAKLSFTGPTLLPYGFQVYELASEDRDPNRLRAFNFALTALLAGNEKAIEFAEAFHYKPDSAAWYEGAGPFVRVYQDTAGALDLFVTQHGLHHYLERTGTNEFCIRKQGSREDCVAMCVSRLWQRMGDIAATAPIIGKRRRKHPVRNESVTKAHVQRAEASGELAHCLGGPLGPNLIDEIDNKLGFKKRWGVSFANPHEIDAPYDGKNTHKADYFVYVVQIRPDGRGGATKRVVYCSVVNEVPYGDYKLLRVNFELSSNTIKPGSNAWSVAVDLAQREVLLKHPNQERVLGWFRELAPGSEGLRRNAEIAFMRGFPGDADCHASSAATSKSLVDAVYKPDDAHREWIAARNAFDSERQTLDYISLRNPFLLTKHHELHLYGHVHLGAGELALRPPGPKTNWDIIIQGQSDERRLQATYNNPPLDRITKWLQRHGLWSEGVHSIAEVKHLRSLADCRQQECHTDFNASCRKLPMDHRPFSVIVATTHHVSMRWWPDGFPCHLESCTVDVPVGQALVMLGCFRHGGAKYTKKNDRVFIAIDSAKIPRLENTNYLCSCRENRCT